MVDNKKIFEYLELIGRLKHIKRTGWIIRDLHECETISGHMYRMAMMTFLLDKDSGLDKLRCMQIALVHDLGESIIGDITPFCNVPKEVKQKKEDDAMQYIASLIGSSGDDVYKLFREYEDHSTPEAKFVKELDKFDAVLQAFEYEKRENTPLKFQDFFDNTQGVFSHPLITSLLDDLNKEREEFIKKSNVKLE